VQKNSDKLQSEVRVSQDHTNIKSIKLKVLNICSLKLNKAICIYTNIYTLILHLEAMNISIESSLIKS
jgi:hypothetical protein